MNFSVDPCTNFFEYSCGNWIKQAVIPPSQGGTAKSWDYAEDAAYDDLRELMQKKYPANSEFRKVSDWFDSCMNVTHADLLGAEPIKPWLAKVDAIQTKEDVWDTIILFKLWSIPTMISTQVSADEKDPLFYDLFIDSGGLILPDISYYDNTTADGRRKLRALTTYLQEITQLAGYSEEEAQHAANQTVEIEMMMADLQYSEPFVELEDSYHHYNVSQLVDHAPHIPWRKLFDGAPPPPPRLCLHFAGSCCCCCSSSSFALCRQGVGIVPFEGTGLWFSSLTAHTVVKMSEMHRALVPERLILLFVACARDSRRWHPDSSESTTTLTTQRFSDG
eukprot:3003527-Rhodomonas_salina.1